jgi:hypothetical protein
MNEKLRRMALEADEFAWARPYLDEARAAVARGEVVSLEEAIADIDAHIESLEALRRNLA